jgi:hypothetical protein
MTILGLYKHRVQRGLQNGGIWEIGLERDGSNDTRPMGTGRAARSHEKVWSFVTPFRLRSDGFDSYWCSESARPLMR